ncbi:MAG: hypothetical protein J6J31_01265 [Thermoguttaceae bacterium]|nr:hypothetical protein [Thermoguttaceae bacterium]
MKFWRNVLGWTAGVTAGTAAVMAGWTLQANEAETQKSGYAVIVSEAVSADPEWNAAAEALEKRHGGNFEVRKFVWKEKPSEVTAALSEFQPRYAGFVARPEEAGREFVASVHQMMRRLDEDPYTDAVWGILTGFEASDAVRMTQWKPTVISKAAGGTSIPLEFFDSGIWYDEGKQGHYVVKESGKAPEDRTDGPADSTAKLVEAIDGTQLMVTSGHATEKDWQPGYSYRNGCFRSKNGELFGVPLEGERIPVKSENSKIWLASGNCLIGHISDRDCMALAMIHSAHVDMMVGYTVPTWFGFMGWGIQDYYFEQAGRFTLAEAFFANNQALTHKLDQLVPGLPALMNKDADGSGKIGLPPEMRDVFMTQMKAGMTLRGLMFDRDVVALYGDPAWENALAEREYGWTQTLESKPAEDGKMLWTLTIAPNEDAFKLTNGNGSQRGGRPIFVFLPERVKNVQLLRGTELDPVVADDFILVPQSEALNGTEVQVIQFLAEPQNTAK